MERRILQPEQIMVPGEYELGNESILKIYFRVFDRGHGEDLPPVIVVRENLDEYKDKLLCELSNLNSFKHVRLPWYENNKSISAEGAIMEVEEKYDRVKSDRSFSHYLIDGNHRTAAATLIHQPISALELQTDVDLDEIRKMVERGELFDFKRSDITLGSLLDSFNTFCFDHVDNSKTVKERIDELTSNGDLPEYMKKRYHRDK